MPPARLAPLSAADRRERVATRLLAASAARSCSPDRDVDWAAPFVDGAYFLPERRVSLYGTPLWDRLTPAARIELSKHEAASTAAAGIWFEIVLDRLLLRYVYDLDPTSAHVRYALTEIGDECRHSLMFSRLVERLGCPGYGPGRWARAAARVLAALAGPVEGFAAALVAEEILDAQQRELLRDPGVQPLVRQVCRIHVTEEARHIAYARAELARQAAGLPRARREAARVVLAVTASVIYASLVHPRVYAAVGLDPGEARRAAAASSARAAGRAEHSRRLVRFLTEIGLIGGPTRLLWRRLCGPATSTPG